MHSHRRLEDLKVPRLPERSGTLLFVQDGRGAVAVDMGGAGRVLRKHSVCWTGVL